MFVSQPNLIIKLNDKSKLFSWNKVKCVFKDNDQSFMDLISQQQTQTFDYRTLLRQVKLRIESVNSFFISNFCETKVKSDLG